jgi:hypothetical protein
MRDRRGSFFYHRRPKFAHHKTVPTGTRTWSQGTRTENSLPEGIELWPASSHNWPQPPELTLGRSGTRSHSGRGVERQTPAPTDSYVVAVVPGSFAISQVVQYHPLRQIFISLSVKNLLYYRILNRQWYTDNDEGLTLLSVLINQH